MSIDLIQEEFIPLKEALQLKELGFNEACIAFFNGGYHNGGYHDWMIESIGTEYPTINVNKDIGNCVKRPTFSQVFRWFRENHKLIGCVTVELIHPENTWKVIDNIEDPENTYYWKVIDQEQKRQYTGSSYIGYKEAELGLLKKLIELIIK